MKNSQNTTNPLVLPDDLPRPVDDGGADHLAGMKVPSVRLRATSGNWVDLSEVPGRVVVYAYPMTGVPGVELPPGWNDIPGARGLHASNLVFSGRKGRVRGLRCDGVRAEYPNGRLSEGTLRTSGSVFPDPERC